MTETRGIAPPTNALSLAGLVLGIMGVGVALVAPTLFLSWFLSFVPALLAIIFGFVGINTANRMNGLRRRLAVWAVVLGFAPIPAWVLSGWLLAAVFGIVRA